MSSHPSNPFLTHSDSLGLDSGDREITEQSEEAAVYEVGALRSDQPSLYFVQLTDFHLFTDPDRHLLGVKTEASFATVLAAVAALDPRPEFLLLTGDLTQDGSAAGYARLKHYLGQVGIPSYWLAGNHDRIPAMTDQLQGNGIRPDKHFTQGQWSFVLLNSHRPGQDSGHLDDQDFDNLRQILIETEAAGHYLVITLHHPPFEVGSDWLDGSALQEREQFFELLAPYRHVRLVLCGHIHQDFQIHHNGVTYLSCPSTCIQFKPLSDDFALDEIPPAFRQIWLHSDGSFATRLCRVPAGFQKPDLQIRGY